MMRLRMTINGVCRNNNNGHFSFLTKYNYSQNASTGLGDNIEAPKSAESKRLAEFRKKLRETTPIDDLGEQPDMHPAQKDDPLPPFPDNTNPHTGEVGGPRGPEPTRYGDWERKGRVMGWSNKVKLFYLIHLGAFGYTWIIKLPL